MRIFSKGVLILGLLSWLCTKAFAEPPAHVFVENFPAVQIIEDKNFKPRTEIFELEKVNVNTYTSVITSYSIHYTKLYDSRRSSKACQ